MKSLPDLPKTRCKAKITGPRKRKIIYVSDNEDDDIVFLGLALHLTAMEVVVVVVDGRTAGNDRRSGEGRRAGFCEPSEGEI